MRRIAFFIPNLSLGGAERWVANISRLLVETQCEVHVVAIEDHQEQQLDPRVCLHVLDSSKTISGSYFGRRMYARKLRKLFDTLGCFDLIISTLPYADHVTHLTGLSPVCFRIANTLSRELASLKGSKRHRRLNRYRSIYKGNRVIAVSTGVKEDLIEHFQLSGEQIAVIYNPIDPTALREKAKSPRPPLPTEPYLLHSGRFVPQKRHDVLLDAWRILIGDCDQISVRKLLLLTRDNEKLRQLIEKRDLQDSVVILGAQQNPYPWVRNASCLVLSSDFEGMPNVLLEALALGVPVASTDCPSGPRELLAERHPDALARVNDPVSLAASVKYALGADFSDAPDVLAPFQPSVVIDSILKLCKS